jgi:hypothetical protein
MSEETKCSIYAFGVIFLIGSLLLGIQIIYHIYQTQ